MSSEPPAPLLLGVGVLLVVGSLFAVTRWRFVSESVAATPGVSPCGARWFVLALAVGSAWGGVNLVRWGLTG